MHSPKETQRACNVCDMLSRDMLHELTVLSVNQYIPPDY